MKYKNIIVISILLGLVSGRATAQVNGPQEIRWMRVGMLHSWFSNAGAEVEYGRRGRNSQTLATDQSDGLRWPARYQFQDHCASKTLRIGCTNYIDPVSGVTYPYKVVSCGSRDAYLLTEMMPYEFRMIGRYNHPTVIVDGDIGTDNALNDIVDAVDPDLPADRVIINKVHTSIGMDIIRKIYAFSQQYHDNYFIYEYTLKNTGIVDLDGTTIERTLTEVVPWFQYRYNLGYEAYRRGWGLTGLSWGLNALNHVVGQDPSAAGFEFRAMYTTYGPHSASPGWDEDYGAPNHQTGYIMAGTQHVGSVTIHADKSPQDPSDDRFQPATTQFLGSDRDAQAVNQYSADLMRDKYEWMTAGHPARTHAEQVGTKFADQYGGDPGGYSQAQGFGPYPSIAPGDSVRIVLAEAVAGIDRNTNRRVAYNWFNDNAPFDMPDGSTTNDRNAYKRAWVDTGIDSLFQTYRRAVANYRNGFNIPRNPPPPNQFEVTSGGDRIVLTWADNADSWPNFDGYEVYRAVGRPDTTFEQIFSCEAGNVVHEFEDKSAQRGLDYYYYVVTKDDGSMNDIQHGTPLYSGTFYTVTSRPAALRRPFGKALDHVRIVPNPYNIRAIRMQFGVDNPDRIAFYGLPPVCRLKIFTERGDLIDTIEHTDGSGDALWNSMTEFRQIIVSGVYILHVEVTEDYVDDNGEMLFRKGESVCKKFVVIR